MEEKIIKTGVAQNNKIIEFLSWNDNDCIYCQCINCEEIEEYEENIHTEDDSLCDPCDACELSGDKIVGFIEDMNGKYNIDMSSEFAYIEGEIYTQFVKSEYVCICNKCSPCYPFQGDIETAGNDYIAYCPEPQAYLDAIYTDTNHFIFEIIELYHFYSDILEVVSRIYKIKNDDIASNKILTEEWFNCCINQ